MPKHDTPLLVLFGSNLGSSEAFARRIASDGQAQGYAVTLADLDAYAGKLPTEGALLIVSASYNGQPPDNSAVFCEWIRNIKPEELAGVRYAVFGTGNRDWTATYQNIPRLLDTQLALGGAERLLPRGEADGRGDFFGDFDRWYRPFWGHIATAFNLEMGDNSLMDQPLFEVEIASTNEVDILSHEYGAAPMKVLENRELTDTSSPIASSKRHIVVELPAGTSYKTGDHFGVLGCNSDALIERVTRRFNLSPQAVIVIHKTRESTTNLPTEIPIAVQELLAHYLELQQPATQNQIRQMLEFMPETSGKLAAWVEETEAGLAKYQEEILKPRLSWLDLLEDFPDCELPFHLFLEHLPTISPRYYSISSSHMSQAGKVDLTVSVLDVPAWSGRGQHVGLCSNYLSVVPAGEWIQAYVRDVKSEFLPPDDAQTPTMMVCAGTGLAPFRGFIQDRARLKAQGKTLGKAMLFYGCRHPDVDYMYKDELQGYEAEGVVEICMACSRTGDAVKYVQDRLWAERDAVWELLQNGGLFYICGEGRYMVAGVREALQRIYMEKMGVDEATAVAHVNQLEKEQRYLVDAWSG
jgi:cytochrome P450/NADPH-cytochrome P450 reductase